MSPYLPFFRAICLSGIGILAGCATHSVSDSDNRNREAAEHYYDQYYGKPPQTGHGSRSAAHQSGIKRHTATGRTGGMIVNPAAPKTYVVKKGDTLWGIARKFLHTPAYWPEIWDKNQRIANPHRIYPGDILHFGYRKTVSASGGEKLVPRIRIERKGSGKPLSTLAPFLAWPRVLDDTRIKNAPYLLASQGDHTLITKGERVYIRNLKKPMIGGRYAIYHPQKPLYDPDTKALLGHQVDYVGYARIDRADRLSSATILDANDAIRKGDRLLPPTAHTQTLRAPIQLPRHKVRGEIISLYRAKYLGADCMIMVINRGKQHHIKPGYTLGIYAAGKVVEDPNRLQNVSRFIQQKP